MMLSEVIAGFELLQLSLASHKRLPLWGSFTPPPTFRPQRLPPLSYPARPALVYR